MPQDTPLANEPERGRGGTRNAANLDALRKGLRDLGYVEGQNLVIEYRSAEGRADRFPEFAAELVRLQGRSDRDQGHAGRAGG